MKAGICYAVGAGENYGLDFEPGGDDFVIAVDAGFCFLEEKGVHIDLVIGDFDTLRYVPQHPNVIALKPEKDDTDMLAAVREGIRAGYRRFFLYCGTGGRPEHTMANLQMLAGMSRMCHNVPERDTGFSVWTGQRYHSGDERNFDIPERDVRLCVGFFPFGTICRSLSGRFKIPPGGRAPDQ